MTQDPPKVKLPGGVLLVLLVVAAAGGVAFWNGAARHPEQVWKVFLVNFLFWSGISISGLVFSAVLELTHASWAGPVRRIAESFAGFLPVSLLLYLLLLLGARSVYPWIVHPPPGRRGWFTFSFFALRDVLAILLLYGLGLVFLLALARRHRSKGGHSTGLPALAFLLVIVYALVFSLIAIDLVMSLNPYWSSTLFPAYFFMGNLYGGIAAVIVASFLWRRVTRSPGWLDDAQARDLGKLLFGFSMLWVYLFWSQYLVIWYGNLPEEVTFLMVRTRGDWKIVSWTVLTLCFLVPFITLLNRSLKRPAPLFAVAWVSLSGIWLERFLLVVPTEKLTPGVSGFDISTTLGFFALFALAQATFLPVVAGREAG